MSQKVHARIFWRIIYKLADGRTIRLLFPYDVGVIKKKLSSLGVTAKKEGRWLWLDVDQLELSKLMEVLEEASFTTFYAQVDGVKVVSQKPVDLINSLKQQYFLVVFTLYDESMEILSLLLPSDSIMNIIRQVGLEENVKVTANDSD